MHKILRAFMVIVLALVGFTGLSAGTAAAADCATLQGRIVEYQKALDRHKRNQPDPRNSAAVRAYNEEARRGNAWRDALMAELEECRSKSGENGTIWRDIRATQPNYPGTSLPKSFELKAGRTKVWVNPNASEHIKEYLDGLERRGASPERRRLATQVQLSSLQAAVAEATRSGIPYDRVIRTGGWELIFSRARESGQLPVLKHALPIR